MSKGFKSDNTELAQTAILRYANTLAKKANFRRAITPIKNWRRTHTVEPIAGYELVSIGCLTAPESCIIDSFKSVYTTGYNLLKTECYIVYYEIGQRLELETIGEVEDILSNAEKRAEVLKDSDVTVDELKKWEESLRAITVKYNLTALFNEMKEHLIAFTMAMRCDATWDYEDNNQLSSGEREEIMDFINNEQNPKTVEPIDISDVEIKKS